MSRNGAQGHRSANDRNSILDIENTLRIAADVDDVVERRRDDASRFRINLRTVR